MDEIEAAVGTPMFRIRLILLSPSLSLSPPPPLLLSPSHPLTTLQRQPSPTPENVSHPYKRLQIPPNSNFSLDLPLPLWMRFGNSPFLSRHRSLIAHSHFLHSLSHTPSQFSFFVAVVFLFARYQLSVQSRLTEDPAFFWDKPSSIYDLYTSLVPSSSSLFLPTGKNWCIGRVFGHWCTCRGHPHQAWTTLVILEPCPCFFSFFFSYLLVRSMTIVIIWRVGV